MIKIDYSKCSSCFLCMDACPFSAVDNKNERPEINANCKNCGICVKSCPEKAINKIEENKKSVDKSLYKGIMVFAETLKGGIHPVSIELVGKARELAKKSGQEVYALLIEGGNTAENAEKLLSFGIDKVFVYQNAAFSFFSVESFANTAEDCISRERPSVVLVGATAVGRSLAPRLAARFKTGLTADCTALDIKGNTDLVQIRPAFGGNIMARIVTPDSRPQFATVRYKVMKKAEPCEPKGKIIRCETTPEMIKSGIEVINVTELKAEKGIEEAEVLVVAGRGLKDKRDMEMISALANAVGGQIAGTRPVIEAGWLDYRKQIGLSGRTVKPRLIITCGVSGAVQFAAGMKGSECIIAINKDRNAPIFNLANYCLVGDIYEIIPALLKKIGKEAPENVQ